MRFRLYHRDRTIHRLEQENRDLKNAIRLINTAVKTDNKSQPEIIAYVQGVLSSSREVWNR